jgi:hypothetical protein
MSQTLELNQIMSVYLPALTNNAEIDAFCLTKYGKPLTIMDGYNGKNPPKADTCPYLAFTGFVKHEGDEIDEFIYHISIMWCISNSKTTTNGNVIRYNGAADSRELGQLIYNALVEASINHPMESAASTIDAFTFIPQFPGYMEATIKIPVSIGGEINF